MKHAQFCVPPGIVWKDGGLSGTPISAGNYLVPIGARSWGGVIRMTVVCQLAWAGIPFGRERKCPRRIASGNSGGS